MKQPGVLFYFDMRPCLKRLTKEEKGELFEAILEYGEFGAVPEFDGSLGIAWDFIQPKIGRDREKYLDTVDKRKYAVFVREEKKAGREPPAFEEWKDHAVSFDTMCYPTTTTTPTTTPTTTTTSTTTTSTTTPTTGAPNREAEFNRLRNESIEKLKNWTG